MPEPRRRAPPVPFPRLGHGQLEPKLFPRVVDVHADPVKKAVESEQERAAGARVPRPRRIWYKDVGHADVDPRSAAQDLHAQLRYVGPKLPGGVYIFRRPPSFPPLSRGHLKPKLHRAADGHAGPAEKAVEARQERAWCARIPRPRRVGDGDTGHAGVKPRAAAPYAQSIPGAPHILRLVPLSIGAAGREGAAAHRPVRHHPAACSGQLEPNHLSSIGRRTCKAKTCKPAARH